LLTLIYLLNLSYWFWSLVLSLPSNATIVFVNRNVLTHSYLSVIEQFVYDVLVKLFDILSKLHKTAEM